MNLVRTSVAALVLAGLVAAPATASAATTCTATVLPTPPGTTVEEVTGTDGQGTFTGSVTGAAGRQGVVWRDGAVSVLGHFFPRDINESGLMGGYAPDPFTGNTTAALRPLDGPVRYLTSGYSTWVNGVNDAGDAVGVVLPEHPVVHHQALWRAPDYEFDGFFGSGVDPMEIDDTGLAIGLTDTVGVVWSTSGEILREYRATDGVQLYDLDDGVLAATRNGLVVTIDGRTGAETVVRGSRNGVPLEINDGVLVGSAWRMAMLWRGGEAVRLPAPAGTTTREASAVNETGTDLAGISLTAGGAAVPTRWECTAG